MERWAAPLPSAPIQEYCKVRLSSRTRSRSLARNSIRRRRENNRGASREKYEDNKISSNLTFASLPLTLLGREVKAVMSQDLDPKNDLLDIGQDVEFIAKLNGERVAWRWYGEGYDHEQTDGETPPRMTALSATMRRRNISAISQTIRRSGAISEAWAISLPIWRRARCRWVTSLSSVAALSISPEMCLMFLPGTPEEKGR
jgi:hypothetical protein